MTRVDFYVLPTSTPHDRRVLACKLTEKAWRQGLAIYLHTASEAETGILDNLLWTFRQGSFIPHEKATATPEQRADMRVLVGHGEPPDDFRDLVINLSLAMPPDYPAFQRVAEIIDAEETVRALGRERYQTYKTQGILPETHKLERAAVALD